MTDSGLAAKDWLVNIISLWFMLVNWQRREIVQPLSVVEQKGELSSFLCVWLNRKRLQMQMWSFGQEMDAL